MLDSASVHPTSTFLFNKCIMFRNLSANGRIFTLLTKTRKSCPCKTSKFCYRPHGHVISGDLTVMENVKLRELFYKGLRYREPIDINLNATKNAF